MPTDPGGRAILEYDDLVCILSNHTGWAGEAVAKGTQGKVRGSPDSCAGVSSKPDEM